MRSALWAGSCTLPAIFALIHRSAWKKSSANFAYPQFSEVRRRASEGDIMLTVERVAR